MGNKKMRIIVLFFKKLKTTKIGGFLRFYAAFSSRLGSLPYQVRR